MNVLAVKTLTDYVGETESYDYLLNFGFTTLSEDKQWSLLRLHVSQGLCYREEHFHHDPEPVCKESASCKFLHWQLLHRQLSSRYYIHRS